MTTSGLLIRHIPGPSAPRVKVLAGALGPRGALFASGGGDQQLSRWSYAALEPAQTVGTLEEAQAALTDWDQSAVGPAPFCGGALGYVGYDEGWAWASKPRTPRENPHGLPGSYFGVFDAIYAHDGASGEGWLLCRDLPDSKARLQKLEAALRAERPANDGGLVGELNSDLSKDEYTAKVQEILQLIRDGEVYQVNLSHLLTGNYHGDWRAAAERLATDPPPFGACLGMDDDRAIISASPECFWDFDHTNRVVRTYPIKGTRPRGSTEAEDERLAAELQADPKERAEHLMIVDLLRNDLGRVATAATVRVPQLAYVERFRLVHHMTSCIEARLPDELSVLDLVRATFPGGSITGAPKLRAMEIIDRLENRARGIYTGSLFTLTPGGSARGSIAIRTATIADGTASFGVGGGIVADSTPDAEWNETWLKAKRLTEILRG